LLLPAYQQQQKTIEAQPARIKRLEKLVEQQSKQMAAVQTILADKGVSIVRTHHAGVAKP
jgi:hypothetical protein